MTTIDPVRKRVVVPCHPAEAFELFTAHVHEWWPLATHSLALDDATGVAITPAGVGGRIVETAADGRTFVWGTVTAWSPGERVAFTWHPGWDAERATHVEVVFTATGAGCEVELVHTGWEHRPDGADVRESYVPGWDYVLGRYAERAG